MLNNLKILLGIKDNSQDTILYLILQTAQSFAENYTNRKEGLDAVVVELAAYRYGKLGAEGLISESYAGASFSYASDIPTEIIRQLNSLAAVRFL